MDDRPDHKEDYKYATKDNRYKYTRNDDYKYNYVLKVKYGYEDKYGNKYKY